MKNNSLCALFVIPALIALASVAPAEEWRDLFDGTSLEGWEQKGGEAKYRVEDGAIVGQSVPHTGNSFLCTKERFSDFILEFEFMGHPELNSGVQIRSNSLPEYKAGRVHGYQVELEQENRVRYWSGGIYDEGRRGWIYPAKTEAHESLRESFSEQGLALWRKGSWNKIKVEAKGGQIKTWLNGELRTDLADDMTSEGFIGLQVHGVGKNKEPMTVKWRKIRLKKLAE